MDDLLRKHEELFNHGVRTGDFAPMLEHFSDDAELVFVGVPIGPFHGKDEIARAYAEQPPDDELEVTGMRVDGDEAVCTFAWRRGGNGTITVTRRDGRIARLVVTVDEN
jgi:ketosteroid isomerase-like protein